MSQGLVLNPLILETGQGVEGELTGQNLFSLSPSNSVALPEPPFQSAPVPAIIAGLR